MKKQVVLDGAMMKDKKGAHQYLARQMKFPGSYKGSLPELEEMLLAVNVPMEIIWLRHEAMLDALEDYGEELFETVMSAAQENDMIGLYVAQSLFEEE